MNIRKVIFILIAFFIQNAIADTLILTDGTKLQGTYAGGSRTRIRFETKDRIRSIPIDDIESLTFNRPKTINTPTRPSAKRPERPTIETPKLQPIRTGQPTTTIAKNTPLPVHLLRSLSTKSNKRTDRFTVHLTQPIRKNNRTLVPKDTQISGRIVSIQSIKKGTAVLEIELTTLQLNNHMLILTSNHIGLECNGEIITVTSGESAFDPKIALGDFITESGDIYLPENTALTFRLTSTLTLPQK